MRARCGTSGDDSKVSLTFEKLSVRITEKKWSGRRGSNPQLSAWEGKYSPLYFQHLQNRSRKICVHATHTVHAVPDLRIAAGRFAGRILLLFSLANRLYF